MNKYRARLCPKCHYFLGFAVARSGNSREAPLVNFCLNCNYHLPVRSIIAGSRTSTAAKRRARLRVVSTPAALCSGLATVSRRTDMETKISPADYARHLRAIGQDLERLRFSQFNLEFTGDAYLVWVKSANKVEREQALLRVGRNRLQKLWRHRTPPPMLGPEESFPSSSSQTGKRLRYSVQELERIEKQRRARRRPDSPNADGHSLSQLLRTLGDLLGQRSQRLLGIAWQDMAIGVVLQTPEGRKEIELFRPDNLYDLWVRMYLRRENRALFDTPR